MPKRFCKEYKRAVCIIDCTEIFIECPSSTEARAATRSQHQHRNTVEFLIGCTLDGTISFRWEAWGGRVSDYQLTKESGFVQLLHPGDVLRLVLDYWAKVLWSDESKFNRLGKRRNQAIRCFRDAKCFKIAGSDGHRLVRVLNGNRVAPEVTVKTLQAGGGSVMVWGAFSSSGVGPLIRLHGRVDSDTYLDMLEKHMLPWARSLGIQDWIFMQDNASIHKAQRVMACFKRRKVRLLNWPPQSPDLNPIENLWAIIKRRLAHLGSANVEELWLNVKKLWDEIPQELCQRLVASMPCRCVDVVCNQGYPITY